MASINQGDDAVARLDAAVTAFEEILTGPEGQTVQVPGKTPQPTLAERVKQNLKPSTDAAAGYAAQAREEATKAAREAETASKIAGLDTVAEAVGLAAIPFPDVWIPLSDSLRMLAGYGREVKVGDDVVANYATLTRNSAATMINKSDQRIGAAINGPRFEVDGLLIEKKSTNKVTRSTPIKDGLPEQWNTSSVSITRDQSPYFGFNLSSIKSLEGGTSYANPNASVSIEAGKVYSISFVFMLADGASQLKISMDPIFTGGFAPVFISSSGEFSEGGALINKNCKRLLGSNLFEVNLSILATKSGNSRVILFYPPPHGDNGLIKIGEVQVEEGEKTSHIPTDGQATTRDADKLTIPRLNNDCAEWYSGPDQINPIVTADTIELYPPAGKAHLRNVRGFFTPLTPAQKAALK